MAAHKGTQPLAPCHPERPHYAFGLCGDCYRDQRPQRAAVCHPERKHYGNGLCTRCFNRERYKKNPEKFKARAAAYAKRFGRRYHLITKFELTLEQYAQLLERQGGVCAIGKEPPGKKLLAVDHDHVTGKVRGLLCERCNVGLGMFQDDREKLLSAIDYLSRGSF